MAHPVRAHKPGGSSVAQGVGLMLVRITVGAYIFFSGVERVSWLMDSTRLADQLSLWLSQATPMSRWYLERVMPGTPVFARLIPLGEMIGGLALFLGFWTRLAAVWLFLLAASLQLASGAWFSFAYLTAADGLPLLGALLGLAIGGGRLPLSLRR